MGNDFEEIYEKYFKDVYRFIFSICRNEHIAEEITQETFFKALKNIDKYNENGKLYIWLCQIAKNTYYTMYKKNKNIEEMAEITSDENLLQKIVDKETAIDIYIKIHQLEEPYKEVFYLRTFCDLSFKEIGSIYNKQENWARVIYYRAKIKIKEELK